MSRLAATSRPSITPTNRACDSRSLSFATAWRQASRAFLSRRGAVLDAYLEALHRVDGIDVGAALRDHRLLTAPRPGNTVEGALRFWEHVLTRALVSGPTLLRVVGEMSSARKGFESDSQMIDFEVAMNTITKRLPTVALCQYDVRVFSGETTFLAIRAHPDLYPLGIAAFLN